MPFEDRPSWERKASGTDEPRCFSRKSVAFFGELLALLASMHWRSLLRFKAQHYCLIAPRFPALRSESVGIYFGNKGDEVSELIWVPYSRLQQDSENWEYKTTDVVRTRRTLESSQCCVTVCFKQLVRQTRYDTCPASRTLQ